MKIIFFIFYIYFYSISNLFAFDIDNICLEIKEEVKTLLKNPIIVNFKKGITEEKFEMDKELMIVSGYKNDKNLNKKIFDFRGKQLKVTLLNIACSNYLLFNNNETKFLNTADLIQLNHLCVFECNKDIFISIINEE